MRIEESMYLWVTKHGARKCFKMRYNGSYVTSVIKIEGTDPIVLIDDYFSDITHLKKEADTVMVATQKDYDTFVKYRNLEQLNHEREIKHKELRNIENLIRKIVNLDS